MTSEKLFQNILPAFLVLVGAILLSVNIYGVFMEIRPHDLAGQDFRFRNDLSSTYNESLLKSRRLDGESDLAYASRLTGVIAQGIAHIHWFKETDSSRYHQLIPVWENYYLWFMGRFSGIPEFERYHFTDFRRSLRRGIGICGDASMIMSQLLDKEGITNEILSYPDLGHVVLGVRLSTGAEEVFDPDYGVVVPHSPDEIRENPMLATSRYADAGYSVEELAELASIYSRQFTRWDGVSHFMTKKYYFEKLSYALKWPTPLVFILMGVLIYRKNNRPVLSELIG